MEVVYLQRKLQALVYDILPSTLEKSAENDARSVLSALSDFSLTQSVFE